MQKSPPPEIKQFERSKWKLLSPIRHQNVQRNWTLEWNQNKQIHRIVVPRSATKFDLEVGQKSRSRSHHGTIGKVLSQRTHMPSVKALPVIVQKLWPRLKFLWQTDRRTDRGTDGRMRFNVPTLSRKRGTITTLLPKCFFIIAMHSVCCCGLPTWRRSIFFEKGTPWPIFAKPWNHSYSDTYTCISATPSFTKINTLKNR